MILENANAILANLEAELDPHATDQIEPLPCCKWMASSTWQKSIRRGQIEAAQRAARTFWQKDRQGFWRRCLLVVVEDIGVGSVGSLDTVTTVLTACASPVWRRQVGDLRVALHLTRLMCAATKSRLGDQSFILASLAPEYGDVRTRLAVSDDKTLADHALDQNAPLIERLLALWFLAGTARRFPSDHLPARPGSIDKATEVLYGLNVSRSLTDACVAVLTKTQYPLVLFAPMLAQAVQNMPRPLYVWLNPLHQSPEVEGIPCYAADTFTRIGKACFRQLQQAVPKLKMFTPAQIGLAVFYMEGGHVDKELTGAELEALKQAGEIADMVGGAGLCLPRYLGLREILAEHWPTLEDIRLKALRHYHDQWRDEQQFEGRLI